MATVTNTALGDSADRLPNYYVCLDVPYNASPDDIEEAFLRRVDDADDFQKNKRMICDAFMCLASSVDRAAYDAFYFHTPCWQSIPRWLSYRNERRRLTWDDTAKENTARLRELQQTLFAALVDAKEAGVAVISGPYGTISFAVDGGGSNRRGSRRARRRRLAMPHPAASSREHERQGLPTMAERGPGSSQSGQSDNTLVGGQANLVAETTTSAVMDRVEPQAKPGTSSGATSGTTSEAAVSKRPLLPDKKTLSRKPTPKEASRASTGTSPGRAASTPLLQQASPVAKKSPAPAPSPARATTGKKAAGRPTSLTTKPVASTATAMTASAALKAKPAHHLAANATQLASSRLRNQRAANTASAKTSSTLVSHTAAAQKSPAKSPQANSQEVAAGLANGTAAATVNTAGETDTTAAAQPAKEQRKYLADSRWANPLTCANSLPGHPKDLDNWQRLARSGKCADCGRASTRTPTATTTVKNDGPSSPCLYCCRMCNTSFCNVCYIDKVVRRGK